MTTPTCTLCHVSAATRDLYACACCGDEWVCGDCGVVRRDRWWVPQHWWQWDFDRQGAAADAAEQDRIYAARVGYTGVKVG